MLNHAEHHQHVDFQPRNCQFDARQTSMPGFLVEAFNYGFALPVNVGFIRHHIQSYSKACSTAINPPDA
jgi:hypothetical protein